EGLENRFARHAAMAETVRQWAIKKGFEILAAEGYRSNTVTTIKNTKGLSVADLNKKLGQQGYSISNGYGSLKEKTFRIAHMADRKPEELQALLDILNKEIE
ncbi:MAG: alanine--glyoxylate aminotransferase family protein, partial [Candidatus Marinimicrobia bacterium]|nr:alanine--glyoxylate aminotransferase family protein [Candidatus Neomarinimicrobiota bacterium]